MLVVGITGKALAGKDTVMEHLVGAHAFTEYRFANPLKDQLCAFYGWDRERIDDPEYKEEILPDIVGPNGEPRTRRDGMQFVGTNGYRAFDPDAWVRKSRQALLTATCTGTQRIVFPDVRFMNEAEMIRGYCGGFVIRVIKLGGSVTGSSKHVSEMEMDSIPADFVLQAPHGAIPELLEQVDGAISEIVQANKMRRS